MDRVCPDCQASSPTIRCDDCHGGELVCRSCALERHHRHPLHCVKVCNDAFCVRACSYFCISGMERFVLQTSLST